MLLLTLRGTPTLYNGDELGMPMAHVPPDRVLDPFEANVPGLGLGRDGYDINKRLVSHEGGSTVLSTSWVWRSAAGQQRALQNG